MTNPRARLIAAIAYECDRISREELSTGALTDERDYVSSLLTRIRDKCGRLGLRTAAHAAVLDGSRERHFGCDAMIILRSYGRVKICLFEAKFVHSRHAPRDWDYVKKNGFSHFSDQLKRQDRINSGVVVWEQFALGIDPGKQPRGFDSWGATCLSKDQVIRFDLARNRWKKWSWDELKKLCRTVAARGRSIQTLLYRASRCGAGEAFQIKNGWALVSLAPTEDDAVSEVRIEVPATLEAFAEYAPGLADRYGLTGMLYHDLTPGEVSVANVR